MRAINTDRLPLHFLVPFVGLLLLLILGVYELLLPSDRLLWLLVGASTIAGTYLRPSAAAAVGWVLVLILGAYLAVNSALTSVSGASWLTLLIVPWLPALTSNVAEFIRRTQSQLARQNAVIEAGTPLHPTTNLPGVTLAEQFIPLLNANVHRLGHTAGLIEVRIANLSVLQTLSSAEQLADLLDDMRDVLRGALRSSDWLFQVADDTLLIFADLGSVDWQLPPDVQVLLAGTGHSTAPEYVPGHIQNDIPLPADVVGQQVLLNKIMTALESSRQLDLELRQLQLQPQLPPFSALLQQLRDQPVARSEAAPTSLLAPVDTPAQ